MMSFDADIDAELDEEPDSDYEHSGFTTQPAGATGSLTVTSPAPTENGRQIMTQQAQQIRTYAQMAVDEHKQMIAEHIKNRPPSDEVGAEALIAWNNQELTFTGNLEQAKGDYDFADWHADVTVVTWEEPEDKSWQEQKRIFAGGDDETDSCIFLDAVQLLLLHLELVGMINPQQGGI